MSSLARRTVRTTAAVAGIAALGAGLAGNAVAAPATGAEAASALQGLPSSVPLADLPGAPTVPDLNELPMLFVFQGPTVNTAGPSPAPSTTPLPDADQVSGSGQVPRLDSGATPDAALPIGAVDGSVNGVALPVSDRASSTPAQVGALSALDSAGLVSLSRLAQERLIDQGGFGMSTDRGGLG